MATNPLAPNCQSYSTDSSGLITGVKLGVTPVTSSIYEIAKVELIPEAEAQGQTVAKCSVLDKNNLPTAIKVRMAWPGQGPNFSESLLPGNLNNEHFISNGYDPKTSQGPLALYVGEHNQPKSDIVYGFGLPDKHHVSWLVVFRERGSIVIPPDPIPPTPTPGKPSHRMGVHLINSREQDLQYIAQLNPAMVRIVNPDPGVVRRILTTTPTTCLVNLRDHLLSEEKQQAVSDPIGTGLRHANWWITQLQSASGRFVEFGNNKRIVVVGINEPGVHNGSEELGVIAYNKVFLERLTRAGIRGMAFNLSVGWPREVNGVIQWDAYRPLEKTINDGSHLANFQSYFYPTPQTNYDKLMNRVFSCPMQVQMCMAEVGYTRQLAQLQQPWGWRGNISATQYAEYLWWCADNVDPRVQSLCVFTSGYASAEWESKDVTPELITQILSRKHNYNWPLPVPPVEPPMAEKTIIFPKYAGKITNFFGQIWSGYSHSGIDISAVTGTPIYCPYPGTKVAYVGDDGTAGYGKYIRVSLPHPIDVDLLFGHCQEILVKQGQVLTAGQIIAKSDNTGNSTGPHIHMELRDKTPAGTYEPGVSSHTNSSVDPFGFFAGWLAGGNKLEFK